MRAVQTVPPAIPTGVLILGQFPPGVVIFGQITLPIRDNSKEKRVCLQQRMHGKFRASSDYIPSPSQPFTLKGVTLPLVLRGKVVIKVRLMCQCKKEGFRSAEGFETLESCFLREVKYDSVKLKISFLSV